MTCLAMFDDIATDLDQRQQYSSSKLWDVHILTQKCHARFLFHVWKRKQNLWHKYIIVILMTYMYMKFIILLMSNLFMKLNADVVHIVLYGKHCIIIIMCSCFSSVLCVTILSWSQEANLTHLIIYRCNIVQLKILSIFLPARFNQLLILYNWLLCILKHIK